MVEAIQCEQHVITGVTDKSRERLALECAIERIAMQDEKALANGGQTTANVDRASALARMSHRLSSRGSACETVAATVGGLDSFRA